MRLIACLVAYVVEDFTNLSRLIGRETVATGLVCLLFAATWLAFCLATSLFSLLKSAIGG